MIALAFCRSRGWRAWVSAWVVMVATMIVDLDHLLAATVYDPDRCSIGFHPLHRWPAIVGYGVLAGVPRTRLVGIGLLVHMALDLIDCAWMRSSVSARL